MVSNVAEKTAEAQERSHQATEDAQHEEQEKAARGGFVAATHETH